jgi:superfamily II DNA or RNA helicase/diadenosine tetraphosphate (Ap4A) HIT family hydrolase
VIGLWDGFPVAPGHALLVTVRHVSTWFNASDEERVALLQAVQAARDAIEAKFPADGYNIGINDGAAAGQTIPHLHVHVIPRRHGDVADPRGGVRYVLPHRGNYLTHAEHVTDAALSAYASSPLIADALIAVRATLIKGGPDDPLLPELKHQLAASTGADFAVAFTLRSGLDLVHPHLQDLLDRANGRVRIITGDYLDATDPDALLRLLDLRGRVECRVFETRAAAAASRSANAFHPKAYLFHHRDGSGTAFVGSSNLSEVALTKGIEWNYRVLESRDRAGWNELKKAFEVLFSSPSTVALTPEWIARYRNRRVAVTVPDVGPEPPVTIPAPHSIQQEALEALSETRKAGRNAGLVVLATGLGKTWLSAFDSQGFRRVLFVAHREEILGQALETYRAIRPHDSLGRYTGDEKSPEAAVLFASIQTLGRQPHLERFAKEEFDYMVVDEFHHAHAGSYRRLIDHFNPRFLLGLTATPERTDGADLLALCEDNLVYRCDLAEGIRRGLLCPFRYFGVPDTVDYRNIPWRNKRFDENELTKAVATQARAANALEQYRKRAGRRTIAFCVSQIHADFMARYFVEHGVSAKAVHAGPTSAPRAESLEALQDGVLSVLCAVDIFNEGVDVPALDTVMMLRPTESRIVWLQQFGRGLRLNDSDPAKKLNVIDYIGNHRSFLLKPQALFGLSAGDREVLNLLERVDADTVTLPPGCEVTYELEAKNILRALLRTSGSAVELLTRRYRDFRDTFGVRPTAAEMFREGYNPRVMRTGFGSWLGFVRSESGLSATDEKALGGMREFLATLEITPMVKSYKMLVLLALLNKEQFPGTVTLVDLALEVDALGRRDPRVSTDLGEAAGNSTGLAKLLRENPVAAWIEGKGTDGVSYFSYEDDTFKTRVELPAELATAGQELVREVVDWRLAEYFTRPGLAVRGEHILRVSHAEGRPILFLPDRDTNPDLPEGWTEVRVGDETLSANFAKVAINVVRRAGSDENIVPALLQRWFGPDAGRPGTRHQVMLQHEQDGWTLRAVGGNSRGAVPYKAYRRAEIAPLFNLPYSERYWGQGFVRQGNHTFLFVTLDKTEHAADFQYKDHFLSANSFQWQSQNRTTQDSESGRSIREHGSRGITIHLFVRAKAKTASGGGAPFYYCGPLEYVSWSGEKPITVIWKLTVPVPAPLWSQLGVAKLER